MISLYNKKQRTLFTQAGFTLIELIVVVGILGVISSITLTSYSKFGGQILLRNLAYDVALSVREAQVYGISARSFLGARFAAGHGVYFNLAEGNDKFYLYTDTDNNNFFTSIGTEWVETSSIGRGYFIDRLCVPSGTSTENCTARVVDILFKRPEPDAIIRASFGSGFLQYDRVRIVLNSPQGNKLSVLVETTGQISIQRYDE